MAEKVPYHTICSCNPANGGSGICGCIMANKLVDPNQLGNLKRSLLTHIPDDWWSGPHITHVDTKPYTPEKPKLVTFIEARIKDCESASRTSDNPTYWQGKIAAYKEILVELNQNNK